MLMYETELQHHGILGMKWGVRRFQNKDGSLTMLGKKHKRLALDSIRSDKEFFEVQKKIAVDNLSKIVNKTTGTSNPISYNEMDAAKKFINSCKSVKIAELLDKAYENGDIQVGLDYVMDKKRGKINLTESGILKEQKIKEEAVNRVYDDNKKIVDKYVDGPKKEAERISRSHELGDEYGKEIRNKVNNMKFHTKEEKKKTIDDMFSKKLREAEKTGDSSLCDAVWQQWNFALDDLE